MSKTDRLWFVNNKQDLYDVGMERLREHTEEISRRATKGRAEGKGNFGYLDDDDIKREQRLARFLKHLLSKMDLELTGKTDKQGYCDKMCYDCTYRRYNFNIREAPGDKEGWYCQAECECK